MVPLTRDGDDVDGSLLRRVEIRWVVGLTALAFTSFFLTLASLPYWAVQAGASVAESGLVTTVMLASTVAAQTTVPALTRRIGVAPALGLGVVLLSAATPLYLLHDGLAWLLFVSAVRGAGFAILTVVIVTLLAVLVPASRRGAAIGLHGLAVSLPNLIAVPAGAALTVAGHFDVVVYLAAAPCLIVLVIRWMARSLTSKASDAHDLSSRRPSSRQSSRAAFAAVVAPCLVLFAGSLSVAGLVTFLPIEAHDGRLAALALLAFGATTMLARWRIGVAADRRSLFVLLVASMLAMAAGLAVVALGLVTSGGLGGFVVVAGALVGGLGNGGIQNLSLVAAFRRAGDGGAMTASAVWNISFDLGIGAGATVVGVVAETGLGIPATYVICGGLLVAGLPLARAAARPATR